MILRLSATIEGYTKTSEAEAATERSEGVAGAERSKALNNVPLTTIDVSGSSARQEWGQ